MSSQGFDLVAMVHLIVLSLWGGVVAAEAVLEAYPFRRRELHTATIRFHYWIDLLVELPLVLAVVATGVTLLLVVEQITPTHVFKVFFGGMAVAVNLFCIAVVVRRGRKQERHPDDRSLWRSSKVVLFCFAAGLACAAIAAIFGFRFALDRLG